MKESNKQRRTNKSTPTFCGEPYHEEAERGDFKRRKMTAFTGYAILVTLLVFTLL